MHPTPRSRSSSASSSLASDSSSTDSWDSELEAREAQLQWDESVRQLHALVNLVAVPWIARYFGRKWAYWLFERYLHVGLGKHFFLGSFARYAPQTWR
ncbi:Mim2p [Rhodotorula paludigena]|uniref:Mim2p n=1 Tax=Rhodotorula paludigena TaxID=86838 RepID=UPI00316E052C